MKISVFIVALIMLASCGIHDEKPQQEVHDPSEVIDNPTILDVVREKAGWFQEGLEPHKDLAQIPADFLDFYQDYIADSIYQRAHIDFDKLVGVRSECDTNLRINKTNWVYSSWNFVDHFEPDDGRQWDNNFYFSDGTFYYEFKLIEVGIIYRVGFELIDSEWKKTLDYVMVC